MLRTTLDQAWIKRTLRPLYGWTQATPKSVFLVDDFDSAATPLYPGMCMMRAGGDLVDLVDGTGVPYGLSADFEGGYGINEISEQGVNALGVWVLGLDAEFEVDSPAFDDSLSWTDPTDGTTLLVHAYTGASATTRGQLVPAGTSNATTRPIGRLIKVISDTTIVVGGLVGTLG